MMSQDTFLRAPERLRARPMSAGLAMLMAVALVVAACGGTPASATPSTAAGQATPSAVPSAPGTVPSASASESASPAGGTLRVGIAAGILDADPATSQDLQSWQILENVYANLVRLDPDSLQPVGDIAKTWEESADHLSWTFHLRSGVQFHNGRTVVAADVKSSLERIMDPATKSVLASDFAPVSSIDAPDPATVVIRLKVPYSVLLNVLASPVWAAITPPEAVATLATMPVGAGPFQFVSQVAKTSVTLKKFPGYWDQPKPYLDGIQYQVIPDEAARLAALQSGQVDFIDSVPLAQAQSLATSANVQLIKYKTTWTDEFGFNTNKKPFSDVRVRQAIAMAINKNDVMQAATYGLGGAADTMVAPASPIKLNVTGLPYDPQKAKQLLAAAGYPSGFALTFAPCGGTAFSEMARASQVIANQLAQVGIRATAATEESGVWANSVITTHDYDAFVCGLIGGLDPDQRTFRYFHTDGAYNFSLYAASPELNALLDQGRQVSDTAQRTSIYTKAWTILANDVPWIPLYWMPGLSGASPTVQGYKPMPDGNLRFETVRLNK
jgi:peptide/nickel transport system substrate-binding protein